MPKRYEPSNRRLWTFLAPQYQAVQLPLNRLGLCELLAPLRPHLNPACALPVSDQPIKLLHFGTLAGRGGLGQRRDRRDTKESYPENFLHGDVWFIECVQVRPNAAAHLPRRQVQVESG